MSKWNSLAKRSRNEGGQLVTFCHQLKKVVSSSIVWYLLIKAQDRRHPDFSGRGPSEVTLFLESSLPIKVEGLAGSTRFLSGFPIISVSKKYG